MFASNLRRLSAFRVALLATLAAALIYLPGSQLGMVQQLEGELLDLRFHARPPQPAADAITLVLIDDPEGARRPAYAATGAGKVVLPLLFELAQGDAAPALPPFVHDAAYRVV